jgi:peroxiredoxin
MLRPALIALVLALPAVAGAAAPQGPIADFALRDIHGRQVALADAAGQRLTVVVFLGVECPLARLYAPRLVELASAYRDRGVAWVAIDSNRQDALSEMGHYAREFQLPFPLLKDDDNAIADAFAAQRTPEVFVLDAERMVRYHGRIDDQYQPGLSGARARRDDLRRALDELLAGKPVSVPETPLAGCLIGRRPSRPPLDNPTITWTRDVARLFQSHCQDCHRPGEIGPMPLLTYQDVQGWEPMIREVVSQGRMPPWHANPEVGHFVNDVSLSQADKQTILDWIDQGIPEGDPAHAPPPATFPEGWHITQPDQVVYMSEQPFAVPAEGIVEYKWFVADPGFKEDRWIKAAECRPGNRAVVHHVTVYYKPPGVPFDLRIGRRVNLLAGYAPGKIHYTPLPGLAFYLPAGTQLVFEMHYTPNGSPQEDRSSIGLVFAKPEEVEKQLYCVMNANDQFSIPPGVDNHRVDAAYEIDEDSLLYFMSPHMHLRGKSFRFDVVYPGGARETLLDIPRFDFGWQTNYILAEPKRLPKGSRVLCAAHYDNSAENLANPDPTATIRWGDQTWEEMMIGTIAIAPVDQDLRRGLGVPKRSFDPSQWWYPQYTLLALGACLLALLASLYAGWRWLRRAAV